MAGVTAQLTTVGLDEAIRRLSRLENFEMSQLADDAGTLLVSSTRERLHETKAAPDGSPWPEWSEEYAATRHGGHSLLVGNRELLDTIAHVVQGGEVHVGSNLVYAAHHQFGGDELGSGIPARPYLGVSEQDELDLKDLVTGTLEGLLA